MIVAAMRRSWIFRGAVAVAVEGAVQELMDAAAVMNRLPTEGGCEENGAWGGEKDCGGGAAAAAAAFCYFAASASASADAGGGGSRGCRCSGANSGSGIRVALIDVVVVGAGGGRDTQGSRGVGAVLRTQAGVDTQSGGMNPVGGRTIVSLRARSRRGSNRHLR